MQMIPMEIINKYMIPEQSFDISLDDWGEVTFVSRHQSPITRHPMS